MNGPGAVARLAREVAGFAARAHPLPGRPLPAVILGARVYPDGSPAPALVARVARGAGLYRDGHAHALWLTGGSPDGRPTEAEVMRRLATAEGVPEGACRLEDRSRTTVQNAERCRAQFGDGEVLLVTSDFHLLRATRLFEARGYVVWPVPVGSAVPRSRWTVLAWREAVALAMTAGRGASR